MNPAISRTLASALVAAGLSAFAGQAHAELIYARLVPGEGLQANGASDAVDLSSSGLTAVFASAANNWVAGDAYNGTRAVAVDLATGVIEVVSRRTPQGGQPGEIIRGEQPVVSANGRHVAFLSYGTLGTNWQIGYKNRSTGALSVASSDATGATATTGTETHPISISGDGRYVAFASTSANLGATGGLRQIFVKDMQTGAVTMASRTSGGAASNGTCFLEPHALSENGRFLAFTCTADLTGGSAYGQLFLRDLQAGTTELVSRVGTSNTSSTAIVYRPSISPDGRFITFQNRGYGGLGYAGSSVESNSGVYIRDRQAQATIAIPRPAEIPSNNYDSCNVSSISNAATVLLSCNMTVGTTTIPQVFLFIPGEPSPQRLTGSTTVPGNGPSGFTLDVNASGLSMVFSSQASNIDPNDTNGASDIFVLIDDSLLNDLIFRTGFEN
ncbi:TolB family protein [Dokdonella sp. MW10]|uniref:TolB family protein n=1 Tax=Dokdonella sp. MW10 TaxID=2992926 RepID=UPI003F7CD609